MTRRNATSGPSSDKKEDEDLAALEAITSAILKEVKTVVESKTKDDTSIVQIVIYESSV